MPEAVSTFRQVPAPVKMIWTGATVVQFKSWVEEVLVPMPTTKEVQSVWSVVSRWPVLEVPLV